MRTVLATLLVILALCFVASAKVVNQPTGNKLLLGEFKALRAENKQCKKTLKKLQGELDAEIAIEKRDNTEIEIIKRLIASTEILVHARHQEKSKMTVLLKALLAKLLARKAKNKGRLRPFQKKVAIMADHCRTKKRELKKGEKALRELRNANKNQRKMDGQLKVCHKTLSNCQNAAASLYANLASHKKQVQSYQGKHATTHKAHVVCKKALNTQHSHHKTATKKGVKLNKDKVTATKASEACKKSLSTSTYNHVTCEKDVKTCNGLVAGVQSAVEGQTSSNKLCSVESNHCQVAHDKHVAACEKTADKAEDLQANLIKCKSSLATCSPKMTKVTADLAACQSSKVGEGKKLDFITAKHADLAQELQKYKPLTVLPTRPIVRPTPIIKRADTVPTASKTTKYCTSSGDPHYVNFRGQRFDLYGNFGIFTLAKYKHVLNVQTLIRQGRRWGPRGLNSDVAVGAHSNVVTLINYKLTINGVATVIPLGQSKEIRDGCVVKRSSTNGYVVYTPEGAYTSFGQAHVGETWKYANVYVRLPENYALGSSGLCAPTAASTTLASANLAKLRVAASASLFGKSVHVPAITVVKGGALHDAIAWKSATLRDQATVYCASLKLAPQETIDCLVDAKLAGTLEGAKTYSAFNEIRDVNAKLAANELKNPASATLRELTRLKLIYSMEKERLAILRTKLGGVKNKNLLTDVDALINRVVREHKFLTHMQSEFAKSVVA